jgi:hypothetical protein
VRLNSLITSAIRRNQNVRHRRRSVNSQMLCHQSRFISHWMQLSPAHDDAHRRTPTTRPHTLRESVSARDSSVNRKTRLESAYWDARDIRGHQRTPRLGATSWKDPLRRPINNLPPPPFPSPAVLVCRGGTLLADVHSPRERFSNALPADTHPYFRGGKGCGPPEPGCLSSDASQSRPMM